MFAYSFGYVMHIIVNESVKIDCELNFVFLSMS